MKYKVLRALHAVTRYVTKNFYFRLNFLILTSLERTFKQKLNNAKILQID